MEDNVIKAKPTSNVTDGIFTTLSALFRQELTTLKAILLA